MIAAQWTAFALALQNKALRPLVNQLPGYRILNGRVCHSLSSVDSPAFTSMSLMYISNRRARKSGDLLCCVTAMGSKLKLMPLMLAGFEAFRTAVR